MDDDELSSLIRQHATRHVAGERLRAELHSRITLAAAAAPPPRRRPTLGWRAAAAGFAAGVALTLSGVSLLPRLAGEASLPAELVADHVRALGAGPLIEVASSDRHTVKPWFQGRLDYAPPVFDLKEDGFTLIGGRVERVGAAPVAVLAFAHGRHVVDVYVWPATAPQAERSSQVRGFNLLHWSDAAMQVWVVSDADAVELERFGAAWRARAGAPR